jgi:release factor glutamine methyltransferase
VKGDTETVRSPVSPHPNPPPLAGEGVGLDRRLESSPPPQAGEGGAPRSGDRVGAGLTIGVALAETAAVLAASGCEEPRRRARWVIAAALQVPATEVFARPERVLSGAEQARIAAIRDRVAAREPLGRVLGRREFWGLDFALSPDTLEPRPESETIVEAVLARLCDRRAPYRFLDLGTGTGCLLLALLSEYPEASGVGIDLAPGAAATARLNAAALGLHGRAAFVAGDWGRALTGVFDAVVANPPYIASPAIAELMPEVRDHDPRLALDGGEDGLAAYRAIAADLSRLLVPGGRFAAEIGMGQEAAVAAIVAAGGLAVETIAPDLAGIRRCLVARRPF